MVSAWRDVLRWMKRLVIVYNPRSTRYVEVERKVLMPARKLRGWMVLKFEVRHNPVEKEAKRLAEILRKGDLVVAAGGDGTAGMVLNAILKSGELATMAALPLGNFNDFSITLGEIEFSDVIRRFEEGRYDDFYPLKIEIDGKHFLYVGMYFLVGMLAEAAGLFEEDKTRKRLARARSRLGFSARKTFIWYLKNKRRKDFYEGNVTDFVALNGRSMAGVVPAKGWFSEEENFRVGEMRNRSLFRLLRVFFGSLEGSLPGRDVKVETIKLDGRKIWICFEGEARQLEGIKRVKVTKDGEKIRVIAR